MKTKMIMLAAAIFLLIAQVCFAAPTKSVPKEDLTIGGISFGSSEEYVISVYGEPDSVSYYHGKFYEPQHLKTLHYGTTFTIDIDEDDHNVYKIKSTGDNGLKTPLGFTVGSDISAVKDHYKNRCRVFKDGVRILSDGLYMLFGIDRDGIITEISIYPEI